MMDLNTLNFLSKLPEQAETQYSELFDPLIHPYRSGDAQLNSLYSQSRVVDIESMIHTIAERPI